MKCPRRPQRHERAIETPRNGLSPKVVLRKKAGEAVLHLSHTAPRIWANPSDHVSGWRPSLLVCEKRLQKVRRGEPSEALHEAAEDPEQSRHRGTLVHVAAAVSHRKASPGERHIENGVSAEDPQPKTDQWKRRRETRLFFPMSPPVAQRHSRATFWVSTKKRVVTTRARPFCKWGCDSTLASQWQPPRARLLWPVRSIPSAPRQSVRATIAKCVLCVSGCCGLGCVWLVSKVQVSAGGGCVVCYVWVFQSVGVRCALHAVCVGVVAIVVWDACGRNITSDKIIFPKKHTKRRAVAARYRRSSVKLSVSLDAPLITQLTVPSAKTVELAFLTRKKCSVDYDLRCEGICDSSALGPPGKRRGAVAQQSNTW